MRNFMKVPVLLIAVLLLFNSCIHLSTNSKSNAALQKSVKIVWDAKLNGDWGVVYDRTVKEYQDKVKRAHFMQGGKIVLKEYSIKEVKLSDSGEKGISVVEYTVKAAGFEFKIPNYKEEWEWQEGAWRVNLLPTLGLPMETKGQQ